MAWDYALVQDDDGRVVLHEAACPDARAAADRGWPVVTLLRCASPIPDDDPLPRHHTCLEGGSDDTRSLVDLPADRGTLIADHPLHLVVVHTISQQLRNEFEGDLRDLRRQVNEGAGS